MARIPTRGGYRVSPGGGPTGQASVDAVSRAAGIAYQNAQQQSLSTQRLAEARIQGTATIGEVGRYATELANRQIVADQQDQAAQARIDSANSELRGRDLASQAWVDLESAVADAASASPDQAEQKYQERVASIQEQYAPTDDQAALSVFSQQFGQRSQAGLLDVRQGARRQRVSSLQETLGRTLDQYQTAAFSARSPSDREAAIGQGYETIDAAVAQGVLAPAAGDQAKQQWITRLETAEASRLIQADPTKAGELLRGGSYSSIDVGSRQKLIESADRFADARTRDQERATAIAAQNNLADAVEAMRTEEMDLRASISDGSAGLEDVQKFNDKYAGFRSAGGRPIAQSTVLSMRADIERRDRQTNRDAARLASVQDTLTQSGSITSSDADFYFQRVVVPQIEADPDNAAKRVSGFVAQAGVVPPSVRAMVTRGMAPGTPTDTRDQVSSIMQDVKSTAPLVYETFPAGARRASSLYSTYRNILGDSQAAADRVDAMLNVPDGERRAREQRLTRKTLRTAEDEFLRSVDGESMWSNLGTDQPAIADPIRAAFSQIYTDSYIATGDAAVAAQEASDVIHSQWGVSRLGDGSKRLMFLAPETRYGVHSGDPERDSEWMQRQLIDDIKAAPGIDPSRVDSTGVMVISDPITRDRGTYRVVWKDTLLPIFGASGEEMRWAPDWNSSATKAEDEKSAIEDLAAARKSREDRLQMEKQRADAAKLHNALMGKE